jgi:hypothetical protein
MRVDAAKRSANEFTVSDQQENDERAELRRVNEQLKESLARCRFMLADARAKLVANSNEQESATDHDEDDEKKSG